DQQFDQRKATRVESRSCRAGAVWGHKRILTFRGPQSTLHTLQTGCQRVQCSSRWPPSLSPLAPDRCGAAAFRNRLPKTGVRFAADKGQFMAVAFDVKRAL